MGLRSAEKPRLLIHIGAGKCGSTAIQHFLTRNQEVLTQRGYLLPGSELGYRDKVSGQQVWYFNDCLRNLDARRTEVCERIDSLAAHMHEDHGHTILLSAENLSIDRRAAALFEPLKERFELCILFYVRRQDDYLIAYWQQWGFKQASDFWAWLLDATNPGGPGDWLADIAPWAALYGDEAITIRRFSRNSYVGGHLLLDFCAASGIEPNGLVFDGSQANSSFNDSLMDVAYQLKDQFSGPHDVEFFEMAARWGGPALTRSGASNLLSKVQRKAVLRRYARSNAELKQRFFPDLGESEPFFGEPQEPAPGSERHPQVDPQIELCMRLLWGAYQDIQALTRRIDGGMTGQETQRE